MSSTDGIGVVTVLVILAVVVGAIAIVFAIVHGVRRAAYIRGLREHGWAFDSDPAQEVANGLTLPPIGTSLSRATDEQVSGRTARGLPFQVFEHKAAGDARIVCMPLGTAFPELAVTRHDGMRAGVMAPMCEELPGGYGVLSTDRAFAAAFVAAAGAALDAFARRYPLDLAVDGDQLTQIGAPKDPDELGAYLEALAPVAEAIHAASGQLQRFRQPPPVPRLGFYRRPSWYFTERDDTLLQAVVHTAAGLNHSTSQVVRGELFPGAEFCALVHSWQTQRTETTTDSEGHTHTRTVTENHSEVIHEVWLPFDMPDLQVVDDSKLGRMFHGGTIDFELTAFNEAYDVRCTVPKFAHDVLHPRQIEFLMQVRAMPFTIQQRRIGLFPHGHTFEGLSFEFDVLAGFFARWPHFVWQDLGVRTPPVTLGDDGAPQIAAG